MKKFDRNVCITVAIFLLLAVVYFLFSSPYQFEKKSLLIISG